MPTGIELIAAERERQVTDEECRMVGTMTVLLLALSGWYPKDAEQ